MPTTSISGAKLFYRDEGTGAPLLLIHAFPLNSTMWDAQIQALAPMMRVIAPDLPGFGQSILGSGDKSIDRYADTLAALLDDLGIERAQIAGLSMGGYTALALIRRHPQRVSALVLADTKAPADNDEARAKRAEHTQIVQSHGQAALAEQLLPTLLSPNAPDALKTHIHSIAEANSREGLIAALKALANRADATSILRQIDVPTTIIVGENDMVTPLAEAQALHAGIANSNLTVIPNAAHIANLEAPEAFNAALVNGLSV